MWIFFIVPLFSALIVVSIFIASITKTLSPLITLAPSLINIFATCPGKGDPIWFGFPSSDFIFATTFLENSLLTISIVLGWPLSSKKTELDPFALGSPLAK